MEFGSGFDNGSISRLNISNETFSCRTSDLSSIDVTNKSFWQIREDLQAGSPIVASVILIMFLVAFSWNLFIIITYSVRYKLLNEPGNIFLYTLAIVDFLLCITVMMFSIVTEYAREFVFGTDDVVRCNFCKTASFFLMFLIILSLHVLTALSIDRFILLSRPLRYKQLMNKWRAIILCIVLIILAFIIAILPVFGFGEAEFNQLFGACLPRFTPQSNFYYIAFVVLEVLIPIIILAMTNVWTYRLVSKFLKRNFRRKSTFRRREDIANDKDEDTKKHQKQQKQLVKVFSALFVANIVSWTPTIITVLAFAIQGDKIPGEVYIFGYISFLTNPLFHPIIQSFFVKDLRYQVSRAKKTIRRASTQIYRQTTQFIGKSVLDEANRKVDEGNGEVASSEDREIRFLSGKKVTVPRKKHEDESMVTEMSNMSSESSRSNSPTVQTPEQKQRSKSIAVGSGVGKVSLGKVGRSVTFSDNMDPVSTSTPSKDVRLNSVLKKPSRKRSPPPRAMAIEEEDSDEGLESGEEPGDGKTVEVNHTHALVDSDDEPEGLNRLAATNGLNHLQSEQLNHLETGLENGLIVEKCEVQVPARYSVDHEHGEFNSVSVTPEHSKTAVPPSDSCEDGTDV